MSPGEASHASPRRAARSIAGGAVAPIQTSTGSAGLSATREESNEKMPDAVTVSPANRRRSADNDSSNAGTRLERGAHRAELRVVLAEPALEDEAPAHDRGQRADLLGDQHGIPERQQEEAPGRFVAPLREQTPEHRHVLVVLARRRVMVADEQRVEVGLPRGGRALDHDARALTRILDGVGAGERDADSQCRTSSSLPSASLKR